MNRWIVGLVVGLLGVAFLIAPTDASLISDGVTSSSYTTLGSKWEPGAHTASLGPMGTPGGATWSIMAAGIAKGASETHGSLSTSMDLMGAPGTADEAAILNAALNVWAAVSSFTNLGQVADGGGTPELDTVGSPSSHVGDIRIGAYNFTGSTLAHAYQPGTHAEFGNGTIGGDIHFDNDRTWVDDAADVTSNSQYDFFTVALHEFGHSLGLGHSADSTSVMWWQYSGARRVLTADDIAGIQLIYGVVPEPSTFVVWSLLAGFGLTLARRRRRKLA